MNVEPGLEYSLAGPRPETPLWSENFALTFNDPARRASMLYSIGTWYHDTSVWREMFAVTLPDGRIVVGRNFGRNTQGSVVSAALSRYEIIEAGKKVALSYDGPVWGHSFQDLMQHEAYAGKTKRLVLDLTFEAVAPIWNMHGGHSKDRTGIAGSMHIEQLGRCRGTLRLDDSELKIQDAVSCRDHSRGPRDLANYRNHCWINGVFDDGTGFHLYFFKLHHIEGAALSIATVIRDNVHHPATIKHVEFADGLDEFGKLHTITLRSTLGDMKIEVKEVLSTIPTRMSAPFNPATGIVKDPHGLMFDEAIRVEWNGTSGFGWCERGFSKQLIA
jgi:hypothetical protein